MASTAKIWSDFFPDPLARPNPFALLRAQPANTPAELSAQAANMQLLADSTQLQMAYRDALRTLTVDPLARAQWEVFSPHAAPPPEGEHIVVAGRLLGGHLSGGSAAPDCLAPQLETLAAHLGWDRRVLRCGGNAPADRVAAWWQKTTHRHADSWTFWHQLALVYHGLALAADKALAEYEQTCSTGTPGQRPPAALVAGYWARALDCWVRALAQPEFWQSIQAHVQGSPGFDAARFEQLKTTFPEALVGSLATLVLDAVSARNRLAAARRWRLLDSLAQAAGAAPLCTFAVAAKDRAASRLWTQVRQQADPQQKLGELSAGLLLLLPKDSAVVEAALEAVREMVSKEVAFTPGKFPEATRMSRLVVRHAPALETSVFAGTDALLPSPSTDRANLLQLFYHLRLRAVSSGGMLPGETVMEYQRRLELLETLEK